jgi:hypothetical protein
LLHLAGEDRQVLVWRDGSGAKVWDRAGGERSVPTPTSGLVELLGWGGGTGDLLLAHFLLAEPEAGFDRPPAAAIEAPVPCGDRTCDVLLLSRLGGALESRILVDREDGLVRAVSTRALATGDVLARAMADAGLRPRQTATGGGTVLLELELEEVSLEAPPAPPVFAPPATAQTERGRETHAAPGSPEPAPRADGAPPSDRTTDHSARADRSTRTDRAAGTEQTFTDTILVREMAVIARVLDGRNRPVRDLVPADFEARIGRRAVTVTAVDWVSSAEPLGWDIPPEVRAEHGIVVDAPGKLVVFFVQADLEPVRAKGHLRMLAEMRELVETFHRDDRIAVVSYDSHLELRQDFTRERERIPDVLFDAMRLGKAAPPRPGSYPSLGRHLDARELRRTASPERALEVTAEALRHFPGEKVVVYVGWGLGRYGAGGVRMTPDYDPARRALARANATVFVLDVTEADYHSLEVGLQQVAADTGGTYERGFHGPHLARERLAATISGYYRLTVEVPTDLDDAKRLRIELRKGGRGLVVMAPMSAGGRGRR